MSMRSMLANGPRAASTPSSYSKSARTRAKASRAGVWLVGFGESSLDFELVIWAGPNLVARPGRTEAAFLWAIEDELRAHDGEICHASLLGGSGRRVVRANGFEVRRGT